MRTIRKNSKELQALLNDSSVKWLLHSHVKSTLGNPCTSDFVRDQIERFKFSKVTQCEPGSAPIDYIVKITSDFWFQGVQLSGNPG